MTTTVESQKLRQALELVARVSTKHVTLPVLQCVLIKDSKEKLTLTTTNLEIAVEVEVAKKEGEIDTVAVPAQHFLQLVQLIQKPQVQLSVEEGVLKVDGGRGSVAHLKSMPHEEFPSLPRVEGEGGELEGVSFTYGVRAAAFAASLSSIKPELGSVHIHQKREHTLSFVATDSFRLMEKTVTQKGVVLENSLLLPQKNALEIARICESVEENPTLHRDENQCAFSFPSGVYVTSRLTTGNFPDYEQIIPKEYSTTLTLLKADLVNAMKKTNIFLNKFSQVRFQIGEQHLTVSADSGEVGTVTESVPATIEGEELSLSFNQRYITDALPYFPEESIMLRCAGVGRPMVITGVNDGTVRYLVMPMNK